MGDIEKTMIQTYISTAKKVIIHFSNKETAEGVITSNDERVLSLRIDGRENMVYLSKIDWIEVCKKQ